MRRAGVLRGRAARAVEPVPDAETGRLDHSRLADPPGVADLGAGRDRAGRPSLEPEANPTLWDFVTLPAHRRVAAARRSPEQAVDPKDAEPAPIRQHRSSGSIVESAPPRKRAGLDHGRRSTTICGRSISARPSRRDSSGDFTWKDPAAAKRFGLSMPAYVITGMDPDFREQLYHAGKAMDAAGVRWAILSAFRDDYRQTHRFRASRPRASNSLHGGMAAHRRLRPRPRRRPHRRGRQSGDRCGNGSTPTAANTGCSRPMPGADPAHVQTGGAWNKIAIDAAAEPARRRGDAGGHQDRGREGRRRQGVVVIADV